MLIFKILINNFFLKVLLVGLIGFQEIAAENCPVRCPIIFAPVCGRNSEGVSHTFTSTCIMKLYNCSHKTSKFFIINKFNEYFLKKIIISDYVQTKNGPCSRDDKIIA